MIDTGMTGTDFAAVAKALREAGDGLLKEMDTAIAAATKPVVAEMRASAQRIKSVDVTTNLAEAVATGKRVGTAKEVAAARRKTSDGAATAARGAHAVRGMTTSLAVAAETGKRVVSRKTYDKRAAGKGLRASIAAGVRRVTRKSGQYAGVRLSAQASALPPEQRRLVRATNRGQWRHPVFGDKETWVVQRVEARWFDSVAERNLPMLREAIAAAVERGRDALAQRIDAA